MLPEGRQDQPPSQALTLFAFSRMFAETSEYHFKNALVKERFQSFLETKKHNAMTPFGGKDYPIKAGPMAGILHSGLTSDISVFYEIRDRDPHRVYLYFIATHDEAGIASRGKNLRLQKNLGRKIQTARDQEFNIESQDPTQE
jgi:hypothetical protein